MPRLIMKTIRYREMGSMQGVFMTVEMVYKDGFSVGYIGV